MRKIFLIILLLISIIIIGNFFANKKVSYIQIHNPKIKIEQEQKTVDLLNELENSVRILFVGDMMFDRYIRHVSNKNGYDFLFRDMDHFLKDYDLVIGNLEGPITDNDSISLASKIGERNNYIFTFNPDVAKVLADKNIRLVNIGNNHITNFGSIGVQDTRNYLTESKVDFFGDPEKKDKRIAFKNIKGIGISFVNYNQFTTDALQKTIDDINESRKLNVDIIVVYTHWGVEYMNQPNQKIKDLAYKFIDVGADVIIGSHPHVVQTKEEYKGKMIYYSLGNFIFDQYFDPRTQKGLSVGVDIMVSDKKMIFTEYEIKIDNNGQTSRLE